MEGVVRNTRLSAYFRVELQFVHFKITDILRLHQLSVPVILTKKLEQKFSKSPIRMVVLIGRAFF